MELDKINTILEPYGIELMCTVCEHSTENTNTFQLEKNVKEFSQFSAQKGNKLSKKIKRRQQGSDIKENIDPQCGMDKVNDFYLNSAPSLKGRTVINDIKASSNDEVIHSKLPPKLKLNSNSNRKKSSFSFKLSGLINDMDLTQIRKELKFDEKEIPRNHFEDRTTNQSYIPEADNMRYLSRGAMDLIIPQFREDFIDICDNKFSQIFTPKENFSFFEEEENKKEFNLEEGFQNKELFYS